MAACYCHGKSNIDCYALLVPLADARCHGIPRSIQLLAALVERQMKRSHRLDEYVRRPPIVGRHRANVSISKWLRRGSFGHYRNSGGELLLWEPAQGFGVSRCLIRDIRGT